MLGTAAIIIVITTIMVEVLKMGLLLWCLRAAVGMKMTRNVGRHRTKALFRQLSSQKCLVVPATGLIGFSRESRRLASHFGDKNGGVDPDRLRVLFVVHLAGGGGKDRYCIDMRSNRGIKRLLVL